MIMSMPMKATKYVLNYKISEIAYLIGLEKKKFDSNVEGYLFKETSSHCKFEDTVVIG